MDKLKKVLSGQDTEDRSGLSEVSAAVEARISWVAALSPARGAELSWDTATGGSTGTLQRAWLPNPSQLPLRRTGALQQGPRNLGEWECGPGASWAPGPDPQLQLERPGLSL